MREAQTLLRELCAKRAKIIVAPDRDVDGLAAGVLVMRAIERLGGQPVIALPNKGEHVHTPSMRARLAGLQADALIVLDMGSRAGPIVEDLPTIVIDHHDAREKPDGAIFVSAAGCEPVAPTGLLAYELLSEIVDLQDLGWLALLATHADLGDHHPFAEELAVPASQTKKTHVRETISLLNSARRAASYQPELALEVLLAAHGPEDIARRKLDGVAALEACREEVKAEVARVARVAPKVVGDVALIRFTSGAQIHPLIATRWAGRLAPKVVLVANDGYLPGRVNFALRSASKRDLLGFLRDLPLGRVEGEFANGHPRATGGSIPPHEFDRMLGVLGFQR
ncbi:MAG TPA: DHH family phosphoesterase [Kofleriaceae bacterium]|nr:DHH family phosphoesterase [Kofleriaceae bacterium]